MVTLAGLPTREAPKDLAGAGIASRRRRVPFGARPSSLSTSSVVQFCCWQRDVEPPHTLAGHRPFRLVVDGDGLLGHPARRSVPPGRSEPAVPSVWIHGSATRSFVVRARELRLCAPSGTG
jgi:hypothetical protein